MKRAEENNSVKQEEISIPVAKVDMLRPEIKEEVFFGRNKLTLSLEKDELTAEKIVEVLPKVLAEHEKNAREIDYLYRYYKGLQPILSKKKIVRPEINNIVLENHAFEIVEFKKAYVYGEPIQYVQKGKNNKENTDMLELNDFMEIQNKASLDKELAEWQYIAGTGYRWIEVNKDDDEDSSPFEMSIPDPRRTFVVYSSGIKGEPLFSGHYSWFSESVQTDENTSYLNKYRIITIYTDKFTCQIKESLGNMKLIEQPIPLSVKPNDKVKEYPLIVEGNRIVEYPLNSSRLGLIELVITGLNAINRIKSADLDDVEQFVQSLLVFINQDVDEKDIRALMDLGAVKINSADPQKPADIKLLAQQLAHTDTKLMVDDLYNNILTICGIPKMREKSSGGDTGQARMLGEGWALADQRAKQDELSFKKSEKQFLKLVLEICKYKNKLKNLKLKDIDIKFTRNKSDNLLVKTQGLMNMQSAQVPPEVAFTTCGLFSDPNDVFSKAINYYGDDFWKNSEGFKPLKKEPEMDNGQNNASLKKSNPKNNISSNEG